MVLLPVGQGYGAATRRFRPPLLRSQCCCCAFFALETLAFDVVGVIRDRRTADG